jgi:hypothetical protein
MLRCCRRCWSTAPTWRRGTRTDGEIPLDRAEYCDDEVKKEEVKTVLVRHSLLLAAQVGLAELVP